MQLEMHDAYIHLSNFILLYTSFSFFSASPPPLSMSLCHGYWHISLNSIAA